MTAPPPRPHPADADPEGSAGPDDLPARLADLRPELPAGLRASVLEAVGLVDRCAVVATPAGPVLVVAGERGVRRVLPAPDPAQAVAAHRATTDRAVRWVDPAPVALRRAVAGRPDDGVEVDLAGCTPFQRDVLAATRTIPPGEVRSYRWVAERIGRPGAVRAVGSALAANPVPLVIPCHRVTRSDGTTGRYLLGAEAKVALLEAEGVDVAALPAAAAGAGSPG